MGRCLDNKIGGNSFGLRLEHGGVGGQAVDEAVFLLAQVVERFDLALQLADVGLQLGDIAVFGIETETVDPNPAAECRGDDSRHRPAAEFRGEE